MNNAGILTFVFLTSVLMWFIISGKGRWWPKLIAILAVVGFAAILWFSAISFTGWPTHNGLPDKALFVAGYAVEPNDEQDGAIYVWLVSPPESKTVYEYRAVDGEPRAYVLPYTREMHEQVQGATDATEKGQSVVFSKDGVEGGESVGSEQGSGSGQPGEGEPGTGRPSGNQGNGGQGTRGGEPGFYILPPSVSNPKG